MALQQPQNWDGLLALWRGLKRVGAILIMALVGAVAVAAVAGMMTCYVYFIGVWVGFPAGMVLGGIWGAKLAPRNAVLVLAAAMLGSLIARQLPFPTEGNGFFDPWLVGVLGFSIFGILAWALVAKVPRTVGRPLAIVASGVLGAWTVYEVVHRLWFSG